MVGLDDLTGLSNLNDSMFWAQEASVNLHWVIKINTPRKSFRYKVLLVDLQKAFYIFFTSSFSRSSVSSNIKLTLIMSGVKIITRQAQSNAERRRKKTKQCLQSLHR